ncbi:MAG: hypothetical protein JJU27_10625 [Gammaproteobacteria bacterium]|nr:hypothetical protein [Gammaproteobacteria bacterium]
MDYTLDLDESAGIVLVSVLCDTTEALAAAISTSAIALAQGKSIRGYLLDMRGTRDVAPVFADYDLAYNGLAAAGFDARHWLAMLLDENDDSRSFFETLASNAGIRLGIFRDEAQARAWLQKNDRR